MKITATPKAKAKATPKATETPKAKAKATPTATATDPTATETDPTATASDPTEPGDGEKRRPGRPVGSKNRDRGPEAKGAVRALRKRADEIRDTRTGIETRADDLAKLIERYRKEHPGAALPENVEKLISKAEIKRGEKITRDAWAAMLTGPVFLVYGALGATEAQPAPEAIGTCAVLWEKVSEEFNVSKWVILGAAVLNTAMLMLPAVLYVLGRRKDQENARAIDMATGLPIPIDKRGS